MDLLLASTGSTDCKHHGRSISVGSPVGTWPSTLVKTEANNREAKSAGRILTHLVISLCFDVIMSLTSFEFYDLAL